ncbi:FANTASTIC FOUR 3-like protein [Tanacetum coccineum]
MEATTMRLKLVSPKSYSQKTLFSSLNNTLQSPTPHKPIDDYFKTDTNLYVHNQNSLKLSQESLEICTESLGSETGSDTSEDDAIFAYSTSRKLVKKTRRDQVGYSKKVVSKSFPPPLTTMSGSTPFQVRPHREGGRLIIEAMETTLGNNCLQAERSHGRLLLTCWKREESVSNMDTNMDRDTDTNTDTDTDTQSNENDKDEEEIERNVVVEKFQRLRRCNEDENGDKGICYNYWEPCCWVAT